MTQVKVINGLDSNTVIVPLDTTIAEVFVKAGIAMGNACPYLNGDPIPDEVNKTLRELGVGDKAILSAVPKKDNNG